MLGCRYAKPKTRKNTEQLNAALYYGELAVVHSTIRRASTTDAGTLSSLVATPPTRLQSAPRAIRSPSGNCLMRSEIKRRKFGLEIAVSIRVRNLAPTRSRGAGSIQWPCAAVCLKL